MPYTIIFSPEARRTIEKIRAYDRARILDAIERHLRDAPTKTSRSRIKALRDIRHPQYRLRIGELRVFYDVTGDCVEVLAVVDKAEAAAWLERWAIGPKRQGGSDESCPTITS